MPFRRVSCSDNCSFLLGVVVNPGLMTLDVTDIGAGRPVFISQFLLGLGGCADGPHHVACEVGMLPHVVGERGCFKVVRPDTSRLFAEMVDVPPIGNGADVFFVGSSVAFLVATETSFPSSNYAVPIFVFRRMGDPARSFVTSIFNRTTGWIGYWNQSVSVMTLKVGHRVSFDESTLCPLREFGFLPTPAATEWKFAYESGSSLAVSGDEGIGLSLHKVSSGVGAIHDLRERAATAVASVVRFGHRVASLVEVALIGRGVHAPRPHYIGGSA